MNVLSVSDLWSDTRLSDLSVSAKSAPDRKCVLLVSDQRSDTNTRQR